MKLASISAAVLMTLSCGAFAEGVAPTYDITGVWSSAGGGTAQFFQGTGRTTAVFVGPDFAHRIETKYVNPTTLQGPEVRVTRASGCTTNLWLTYTVQSSDLMSVSGVVLDSNCDLVKGQIVYDTVTRVQ